MLKGNVKSRDISRALITPETQLHLPVDKEVTFLTLAAASWSSTIAASLSHICCTAFSSCSFSSSSSSANFVSTPSPNPSSPLSSLWKQEMTNYIFFCQYNNGTTIAEILWPTLTLTHLLLMHFSDYMLFFEFENLCSTSRINWINSKWAKNEQEVKVGHKFTSSEKIQKIILKNRTSLRCPPCPVVAQYFVSYLVPHQKGLHQHLHPKNLNLIS